MRDDLAYEELLDVLEKRLQIVRRYSGSYHLEKITSALFTGVKDQKLNVYFKPKCTGAGNATTSLWECLDADWHSHERSHYMLVGEGGSGKTIAMQSTSQLALEQSVPAIYVPLHDLDDKGDSKYKPIESYIRRSVLHDQ